MKIKQLKIDITVSVDIYFHPNGGTAGVRICPAALVVP